MNSIKIPASFSLVKAIAIFFATFGFCLTDFSDSFSICRTEFFRFSLLLLGQLVSLFQPLLGHEQFLLLYLPRHLFYNIFIGFCFFTDCSIQFFSVSSACFSWISMFFSCSINWTFIFSPTAICSALASATSRSCLYCACFQCHIFRCFCDFRLATNFPRAVPTVHFRLA